MCSFLEIYVSFFFLLFFNLIRLNWRPEGGDKGLEVAIIWEL